MALTLAQVKAAITTATTYAAQSVGVKTDIVAVLKGAPTFSKAQRDFLANAWLLPTQAQVDAANAVLPALVNIPV